MQGACQCDRGSVVFPSASSACSAVIVSNQDRANLADVRSRKAFQFVCSSSIESAPNFSVRASARTKATIASATTAAAGTAQTSLRSIAAGLSSLLGQSIDPGGLLSRALGVMLSDTPGAPPLVTPPSGPPAL